MTNPLTRPVDSEGQMDSPRHDDMGDGDDLRPYHPGIRVIVYLALLGGLVLFWTWVVNFFT